MDEPPADNLVWYGAFFDLFGDFRGYVDQFLLNDLVADDYASVTYLQAFDVFAGDRCRQRTLLSTSNT